MTNETAWEAFIAGHPAQKVRNEALRKQAGEMLGISPTDSTDPK